MLKLEMDRDTLQEKFNEMARKFTKQKNKRAPPKMAFMGVSCILVYQCSLFVSG